MAKSAWNGIKKAAKTVVNGVKKVANAIADGYKDYRNNVSEATVSAKGGSGSAMYYNTKYGTNKKIYSANIGGRYKEFSSKAEYQSYVRRCTTDKRASKQKVSKSKKSHFFNSFSLRISGNIRLLLGISFDVGVSWDRKGNYAVQYSYAIPFKNDTFSGGVFDVSGGAQLQFNRTETVYDLEGYSDSVGASGGYLRHGSFDLINSGKSSDNIGKPLDKTDGFGIGFGAGFGIDVHDTQAYTKTITSGKIKDTLIGKLFNIIFK